MAGSAYTSLFAIVVIIQLLSSSLSSSSSSLASHSELRFDQASSTSSPSPSSSSSSSLPSSTSSSSTSSSSSSSSRSYLAPKEHQRRGFLRMLVPIEQTIFDHLFLHHYNPSIRPVRDVTSQVLVQILLSKIEIHGLAVEEMMLRGFLHAEVKWIDYRLTWLPEEFNHVTDLLLPVEKIWRPELLIDNGPMACQDTREARSVNLQHDGWLLLPMKMPFASPCKPRDDDIIECHVIVTSNQHHYRKIKLEVTNPSGDDHAVLTSARERSIDPALVVIRGFFPLKVESLSISYKRSNSGTSIDTDAGTGGGLEVNISIIKKRKRKRKDGEDGEDGEDGVDGEDGEATTTTTGGYFHFLFHPAVLLEILLQIFFGLFGLLSLSIFNDLVKRLRFLCKLLSMQFLVSTWMFACCKSTPAHGIPRVIFILPGLSVFSCSLLVFTFKRFSRCRQAPPKKRKIPLKDFR